jgi:hypothetical protein
MSIVSRWTILLFLSLQLGSDNVCADSVPDGMAILAKILESRQSIQRGHVEIETVYEGNNTPDAIRKKWSIWFDGNEKRRSEVAHGGNTEVVCLDCYAERTELYYTTRTPTDPDTIMALAFYDGYGKSSPDRTVPNPRWFGCLPDSIKNAEFYLSAPEIYGSRPENTAEYPKVVSDVQANVDCWKVSFVLEQHTSDAVPDRLPYTIWVDKSDISRLLRAESRVEAGEILYINGVDSESEKYQNKIWFPKKLTYKRTEDGKVTESQDVQIKVFSLNEPLPKNTFSPQGISIVKPGTPVEWALDRDRPVLKGPLVWDGNEVVAEGEFELNQIMAKSIGLKPISIFFILLGVALILFGIGWTLWKRYGN